MNAIVKYFYTKLKENKITDKDRLFLLDILYGDLNLVETLEELIQDGDFDKKQMDIMYDYIKVDVSQEGKEENEPDK